MATPSGPQAPPPVPTTATSVIPATTPPIPSGPSSIPPSDAAAPTPIVAEAVPSAVLDVPPIAASNPLRNSLTIERSKELVHLLRTAYFFSGFTHDEIKKIVKISKAKYYAKGETILNIGDVTRSFFVVLKGKVAIAIEGMAEEDYPIVPEGMTLGELALLERRQHRASCIAIEEEVVALEITDQILQDEYAPIPMKVLHKIALILGKRISSTNQMLGKIATEEPKKRSLKDEKAGKQTQQLQHEEMRARKKAEEEEAKVQAEAEVKKTMAAGAAAKAGEPVKEEPRKEVPPNPLAVPTGTAEEIDKSLPVDEYDVIIKKLQMRIEFLAAKIPGIVMEAVTARMAGYWTGAKLAKINPHNAWDTKLFAEGKPRLLRAMHMVVLASKGGEVYTNAFLDLPFIQKVMSYPQVGFTGTFLGSDEDIERYLADKPLKKALAQDFDMPIDREWYGKDAIEFLTHTTVDVREETLFLVFDEMDGNNTRLVRNRFPGHQIVTVVYGSGFNKEEISSIFTQPEKELTEFGGIVAKKDYQNVGFYMGQTFFLPDFSLFYSEMEGMELAGAIFGMIYILAQVGPDYSGITWGSKGGAEGAVKAARAMFGVKGAQSASDIASAVNWADG